MWLVFWVISNVATGFYSLDLAPAFYKWGYAWPLHNSKYLCLSSQVDLSWKRGLRRQSEQSQLSKHRTKCSLTYTPA